MQDISTMDMCQARIEVDVELQFDFDFISISTGSRWWDRLRRIPRQRGRSGG
jgi:putative alpha-1,2-mannosidase